MKLSKTPPSESIFLHSSSITIDIQQVSNWIKQVSDLIRKNEEKAAFDGLTTLLLSHITAQSTLTDAQRVHIVDIAFQVLHQFPNYPSCINLLKKNNID